MTSMFAHNFQTSIDWARCATGKRLRPSCAMDLTRLSTSQPNMAGILLNSPLLSRPEVGSIKTVKTSPNYSASPTQQPSCCGRCRALRTSVTTIAMNPYGHQGTTDSLIARPYLPESKVGTRIHANISSAHLACNLSTQSPDQCSTNSAIRESRLTHFNPAEHRNKICHLFKLACAFQSP